MGWPNPGPCGDLAVSPCPLGAVLQRAPNGLGSCKPEANASIGYRHRTSAFTHRKPQGDRHARFLLGLIARGVNAKEKLSGPTPQALPSWATKLPLHRSHHLIRRHSTYRCHSGLSGLWADFGLAHKANPLWTSARPLSRTLEWTLAGVRTAGDLPGRCSAGFGYAAPRTTLDLSPSFASPDSAVSHTTWSQTRFRPHSDLQVCPDRHHSSTEAGSFMDLPPSPWHASCQAPAKWAQRGQR